MLVAKKKVLENLEDGYGKDGDDDEKEDSGDDDDGLHLESSIKKVVSFPNPLAPGSDIQIHVSWGT